MHTQQPYQLRFSEFESRAFAAIIEQYSFHRKPTNGTLVRSTNLTKDQLRVISNASASIEWEVFLVVQQWTGT